MAVVESRISELEREGENIARNYGGDWRRSSFGYFLVAPKGAKEAIVCMAQGCGGLSVKGNLLLAHQVYLKNIVELVGTYDPRVIEVFFMGSGIEEDYRIRVYSTS